jgi:hypothetical protein
MFAVAVGCAPLQPVFVGCAPLQPVFVGCAPLQPVSSTSDKKKLCKLRGFCPSRAALYVRIGLQDPVFWRAYT